MIEFTDNSEEIIKKIENVKKKVLSGKLSLLDLELNPIFQDLKDSLNIFNISKYSGLYREACFLLNQKFEELKAFLKLLESDKLFFDFLSPKRKDSEILELLEGCWRKEFIIQNVSFDLLEECNEKYSLPKIDITQIDHLKKPEVKENFWIQIPKKNFTEKMLAYFSTVKKKLPCKYEDIFEDDENQIEIFENFVYLLHLLQLGKIKYQKETKSLYL